MKIYKLLVITVTYKPNKEELRQFIESFIKYNDLYEEAKLIIVDNSPKDYREVENFILVNYPQTVKYIESSSNPGFGAANNIGFQTYKSDYALFINNDVEFTEPIFKRIIQHFENNQQIGCIGIHQEGGSPSFFEKMNAPKNIDNSFFQDKYHFISGAFMFFKSRAFIECGKFDSSLFIYFEEFDISTRLNMHGYCTIYLPNISFLHKVGNRRIVNEFMWKAGIPSFCHICRKYDLDPKVYSKGPMKRLRKLQLYFLIKLNIKEIFKIERIIKYRKQYIYNEFKIKI